MRLHLLGRVLLRGFCALLARVTPLGLALALAFAAPPTALAQAQTQEVWESNFGPVTLIFAASPAAGRPVSLTGFFQQSSSQRGEIRSGTFDPVAGTLQYSYFQPWNDQNGTAQFRLSADGKTFSGTYTQQNGSGAWTLTRSATSVLPGTPSGAAPAPPGAETTPFDNWNRDGVSNRPSNPTTFRLAAATLIARVTNYHWNDGRGAAPGTIALRHESGTLFGPWPARATAGSGAPNVNWIAEPNVTLPDGLYTVIDSDEGTWSHNAGSGGRGFTSVQGRAVAQLGAAAPAVPPAVAAALARDGYLVELWDSDFGPVTLVFQGIIDPPGTQAAITGVWEQPAGSGDCPKATTCIGQFIGTLDFTTGTLESTFYQPWNEWAGNAFFVLAADGLSFLGSYEIDGEGDTWNMWRAERTAASR